MNRDKLIAGPWFNYSSQKAAISFSLCLDIKCGLAIRLRWGIVICFRTLQSVGKRGTWLVHSVERATPDLGVRSLSPTLGVRAFFKKKKKKLKKIQRLSKKAPTTQR